MGLKKQTTIGFIWQACGSVGSGLIGLVVTMILAHNLSPSDFGLIEIILSFIVVSEVFVDSGFSQAIIREKDVKREDLNAIFTLNLLIATLIYLALFFFAPLISSYYYLSNDFIQIFRILCIKIVVDAFTICQIANCTRQMKFDIIAQITVLSMIVSAALSVTSILCGLGIWSFLIYYLGLSVCKAVLINRRMGHFSFVPSCLGYTKKYLRFGGNLLLVSLIDKGITSIESLCVGRVYSKTELGNFSQARKFDSLIIQSFLAVVQKVTYPALAKIDVDKRLRESYRSIMCLALFCVYPIAVFSFFNAEMFMNVFFGEKWIPAADFLRIFSVYSMLVPLQTIGNNIFLVKKRTDILRNINICKQILRLLVIVALVKYSISVFTIGIVSVMFISSIGYIIYSGRLINYSFYAIIKDNLQTFITAFIAGVVSMYIPFTESVYASFILRVLEFAVVYLILSVVLRNKSYSLMIDILYGIRK